MNISINGDALDLIPRMKDREGLSDALKKKMQFENEFTVDHIHEKYLHFSKEGPTTMEGCRFISGRLYGSLYASKPVGDIESGIQS